MTGRPPARRPRPNSGARPASGDQPPGRARPAEGAQSPSQAPVNGGLGQLLLLIAGYLIFFTAGALCATYEVLLVPTRWGATLIPIAPLLAIGSNIALPVIARGLTRTAGSAMVPVLGWFVAVFLLASARPEGDVLLPAGDTAWVSYGLLLCGALAAIITLVAGDRPGRLLGRWFSRQPAAPGSDSDDAR